MSTKASIKWREQTEARPGFHLYDDVLDGFGDESHGEPPVYLQLEGVEARLETLRNGGACVTVTLPREMARALGLLPADSADFSTFSTPAE